jgi:Fe-S-cluster containining protein
MDIDLMPFFKGYEALVARAEGVFEHMKNQFSEAVRCKPSCSDCCFALFDLTLIEALYLNHHFNQKFDGEKKEQLIERANKADRKTYKIKRRAYRATQEGKDEGEVLKEIAAERIRCPLLSEKNLCELYDCRPIACRGYGIPTAIGGKGHVCGLSGFKPGQRYPTFNQDIIHDQLVVLSAEFARTINSSHIRMTDILVPVSMALITDYDDTYLGIAPNIKQEKDSEGNQNPGEKNG